VSDNDWRDLYPFSSNFASTDAGRMHYLDEGDGSPVVMLHGNPTWSFMYRDLIAELSPSHRVVCPDHIGCGLSEKPQDWSYRLRGHIDNLEVLLDQHLKLDTFSLVLHDWGGAIGMGYAVRHPERIDRIVVLNTAAFLLTRCPWRIRVCRTPILGALAIRGLNVFARAACSMAVARGKRLPGQVRQGFLHPYDSWANRIATQRFVQDIPLRPRHPSWDDVAQIQKRLHDLRNRPMLICWGDQDFCFNSHFLAMWQQYFPEADVHRFADAGHYVLEDAGERILPMVKTFLTPCP